MYLTIRSLSALLISAALLLAGGGLQTTLLALRASTEGFPVWVIGLLLSAYSGGFILGCLRAPALVASVGHIRVFSAFAAITAASAILYVVAVDPLAWMILRAINGFCLAGLTMVIESWMNDRADNSNRGRLLAVYRVVDLSSVTIGQLLLMLGDTQSFHLFALVSILISYAVVPVALTRATAPAPVARVSLDFPRLFSVSPLSVATCLGVGLANGAFWALAPTFVQKQGYSTDLVAWFMVTAIVGGALIQYPIGYLSDLYDRRRVLILSTGLAICASLSFVLLPVTGTHLLISAFAFGSFAFPMYGLAIAHANDSAKAGEFVRISSGLLISYSVGAVIGPIVAGLAIDALGPKALFMQAATIQTALLLFGIYRMTRRAAPPPAEQAEFVSVPKTTPAVFQLDPRSEDHEADKPRGLSGEGDAVKGRAPDAA